MSRKMMALVVFDADDADKMKMPPNSWHVVAHATLPDLLSGKALDDLRGGFDGALSRRRSEGKSL